MEIEDEVAIWKGGPSQLLNWKSYLVGVIAMIALDAAAIYWKQYWLFAVGLLPFAWMVWKYLEMRCRVFELTSERLRLSEGVLNQKIAEVELYRVKDSNIFRPFLLRIFGLSTIKLDTSDRTLPVIELDAIRDGLQVRELLRKQVEMLRDRKRVREVDFDDSDDEGGLELDEL